MATETIKIEKVTCDVCGKEIKDPQSECRNKYDRHGVKNMTDIVKITADKNEASFVVKCRDSGFAKSLSGKIRGLWEKIGENGGERGSYAHEMKTCGDLSTCVPCNEDLLLQFDVRKDDWHDRKVDRIYDFVKRCATELYLAESLRGTSEGKNSKDCQLQNGQK